MSTYSIGRIIIENLRGFSRSELDFSQPFNVLVGPNNSGKSSAFIILNWIFNGSFFENLEHKLSLDPQSKELVRAARETGRRPRRITLKIGFSDNRYRRKFKGNNGEFLDQDGKVIVRINFYKTYSDEVGDFNVKLGPAYRGEDRSSDKLAIELLKKLRNKTNFIYIPSFRDAKSERFQNTFETIFKEALGAQVEHNTRGGAPKEYRKLNTIVESLEEFASSSSTNSVDFLNERMPSGFLETFETSLKLDRGELIRIIGSRIKLKIATGEHDKNGVTAEELGSGLQSFLDIAAHIPDKDKSHSVLVVDEPEAFLHPSAQREIYNMLKSLVEGADPIVNQVWCVSHSPVFVDESNFEELTICQGHRFSFFSPELEESRKLKNTAFLRGAGSFLPFAKSILLVEGDGDRLFYEGLRRRWGIGANQKYASNMLVISVGGVAGFGPWINLINSFQWRDSKVGINWLVVADGDEIREARKGIKEGANYSFTKQADKIGKDAIAAFKEFDVQNWHKSTLNLNKILKNASINLRLHRGDLEYEVLNTWDDDQLRCLGDRIAINFDEYGSRKDFIKKLGSKGVDGKKVDKPRKDIWMRAEMATLATDANTSDIVKEIMGYWAHGAGCKSENWKLPDG